MMYRVVFGNWDGYQGEVEQLFASYEEADYYADQYLGLAQDEWYEVEEVEG